MTTQTENSYTKHYTHLIGQHPIRELSAALQQWMQQKVQQWAQQWTQQRAHRKTYFELLKKPTYLIRDVGLTGQQINREIDRTSMLRWK